MKTFIDLQGCKVRLTPEREAYITKHPELEGMEKEIERTIERPERVVQSNTDPSVKLSYRHCEGTKVGDKWLCVVVKCLPDDAFIITSYFTDQIKKGTPLWPTE